MLCLPLLFANKNKENLPNNYWLKTKLNVLLNPPLIFIAKWQAVSYLQVFGDPQLVNVH